jgi:biopolymer transport protein ExbB
MHGALLELILHGGVMMFSLIACSVVGVGVVFERWETLRKAEKATAELLYKVREAVRSGDVKGGIAICDENPGPVAATLGVGLRKLVLLEGIGKKAEEIEKGIVDAMEEHGGHVVNYLERNLTTLATCASLGPILGMIGTVIGMIKAFGTAGRMGQMTPAAVALGISEALIATASGLIVAAIGTVAYNYFSTRVNRLVLEVQAAATEMVEHLLETRASRDDKKA